MRGWLVTLSELANEREESKTLDHRNTHNHYCVDNKDFSSFVSLYLQIHNTHTHFLKPKR